MTVYLLDSNWIVIKPGRLSSAVTAFKMNEKKISSTDYQQDWSEAVFLVQF